MAKKNLEKTPRSRVREALRRVFLRSRERASAIKRDKHTCQCCGRKASKAKGKEFSVEVHHRDEIYNWDVVIDAVYEQILSMPETLETLCKECHKKQHEQED